MTLPEVDGASLRVTDRAEDGVESAPACRPTGEFLTFLYGWLRCGEFSTLRVDRAAFSSQSPVSFI